MSYRLSLTGAPKKSFYIVEDYINPNNGKRSTRNVQKLGSLDHWIDQLNTSDLAEIRSHLKKEFLSKILEEKDSGTYSLPLRTDTLIPKGVQMDTNVGFLFLKRILYALGIEKVCRDIEKDYKFQYDLCEVLTLLVYTRILFPGSKRKALKDAERLFDSFDLTQDDIYRSLPVLAKETYRIEASLYKNSGKIHHRDTSVLFYDCTNFYCEIEEEDEDSDRKYGKSKEHRPNPIVQYGLFMSGDGIPLADYQFAGNKNEQPSLQELEKTIEKDFGLSRVIICTDAGLNSFANKLFNDRPNKAFVSTQSVKKLKKDIKESIFDKTGWKVLAAGDTLYTMDQIKSGTIQINNKDVDTYNLVFYKSQWIKTTKTNKETKRKETLEEQLIVTYSPKYAEYQKALRQRKLDRLDRLIENPEKIVKRSNDQRNPMYYAKATHMTEHGEVADKTEYEIDWDRVDEDKKYDGFYGVTTNLAANDEGSPKEKREVIKTVLRINHNRWEIEESFEIMKSEFKARPMFVSKKESIRGHLLTCFISLLVLRLLEKVLEEKYPAGQIIDTLRDMSMTQAGGVGYIPSFKRTDITDELFDKFSFRTDYEFVKRCEIKKISTRQKREKIYANFSRNKLSA